MSFNIKLLIIANITRTEENMAKVHSDSEKEMTKVEAQFKEYDDQVKSLTLDRMNMAPKQEKDEPKISAREVDKSKEIWLKPKKTLGVGVNPKTGEREKFNETFRKDWEFAKEYVQFTAYNEILGETICDLWTKPFPGTNCESWDIPVNKAVWGPRYLAERLKGCQYHKLSMSQHQVTGSDGMGTYHGSMVVDTTVNRLDAYPVNTRKSVFMGAGF